MRGKREKFAENVQRQNVIEPGKAIYDEVKGNWNSVYFKNDHNVVLELACGRGEYTVGMARLFPDKNFIGVDIKGDRIWKGSGIAIEENLDNVAFLRTHVQDLGEFIHQGQVSDIWITFPDPRPRKREARLRLTHPRFLDLYKSILTPDGIVRLKTDNTPLFDYTLSVLDERKDIADLQYSYDLYHSPLREECLDITTKYEEKFVNLGQDIKYLRFGFS